MPAASHSVALLAEGVDRNSIGIQPYGEVRWSPSSRRAWIEIARDGRSGQRGRVALLAEGVDRNLKYPVRPLFRPWSPSSRRAWIEISFVRATM